MKNPSLRFLLLFAFLNGTAQGASPFDVDFATLPGESEYQTLTQSLLSPLRFSQIAPGRTTELSGFDFGVAATTITLSSKSRRNFERHVKAGRALPKEIYLPRLIIQKGVLFGVDVGFNLFALPETNAKVLGGGAQYVIDLPTPALPLRAAARAGYSALLGLPELEADHLNIEGLVSLGMPPAMESLIEVEPYAGYGVDFAASQSQIAYRSNGALLRKTLASDWKETYALIGLRIGLSFVRFGGEAQISTIGTPASYSVKVSVGI